MSKFETLLVDQSGWGQIRVTGSDRVRFLQGMCTSNIETLATGSWVRASMLNAKGRVVSVFDVVAGEDHVVLVCEPQLTDKTITSLGKYAIVDDVVFEAMQGPLHRIWPDPESVWTAPPVFAPAPGPCAGPEAVEVRRVEAGFPSYGVDVDEDNFPFETPLERHIDYTKGCYVGQEPVARVHARGSANKMLRGLRVHGSAPVAVGTAVTHAERADAGRVTSTASSPVLGVIAMAYVHKSAWEPGTEVALEGRAATVCSLPFEAA